jgi:F-type H+-transporting ATPase subunit a
MIFAAESALDHVLDTYDWHLVDTYHAHIPLLSFKIGGTEYGISKYSILMAVAAVLIVAIYLPLAKKIQSGAAPTGIFWNLFEGILTFIRDNIAKPYIGKDADKYVHFLWTIFLFILFCNLFGMIPFLGSPTASFTVTAVLAACVFVFIHYNSIRTYGLKAHLFSFAPHLDLPLAIKIPILFMLWPIEFGGLMLKCFVLAVRLFANMFAGHIVLGTILLFIPMVKNSSAAIAGTVTLASVFGVFALSFLELFVAFLHAFLFAFLTALFFGGILEHAEHAAHAGGHTDGDHGHSHVGHGHEPPDAGPDDIHPTKPDEHGH